MRVFVADKSRDARSAMRLLLEQEPDMCVAGEAGEAESLLQSIGSARVEVLMLDWNLCRCGMSGLVPSLLEKDRNLTLVAMSGREEDRTEALRAGAHAFVSKCEPPEELLRVLRDLTQSRKGLTP